MQDPQKLQEENERLKAELATYKDAEKAQKQKRSRFIKRLGSWGSWFFLGGDLKQSIKKLVVEVRDTDKELSSDTLGDVLAHGAWRFTRIGCFAVIMAFIPLAILVVQTTLLYYQNQKIDTQNELFKLQNDKVTEQTDLMQSQNSLLESQNTFFQRQLGQIDTQNLFISEQIEQADIQNRLVLQQNLKIEAQNKRLDQQTYLQEADRRSSLVFLFSNIMDAIDKELKEDYGNDNTRNLSPQLIGRIVALSIQLKPYRYLNGDTLINKPLSPERTQLLINLIHCHLDSITSNIIFQSASFSNANFYKIKLQQKNLSFANLQKADFRNSNLEYSNLSHSNLTSANFTGESNDFISYSYLRPHLPFNKSGITTTNLSNTNFSNANMTNTILKNADLSNALMTFTDLTGADLERAYLIDANLKAASLENANLEKANLEKANLEGAYLSNVNMSKSGLVSANLNNTLASIK